MLRRAFHPGLCFAMLAVGLPLIGFQVARDLSLELDDPAAPTPGSTARWALVVGVSGYQHLPPRAQLQYAHRDAEDYANFLRGTEGGSFAAARIRLLTNEAATVSAVRASLSEWLPAVAGPRDIVYLFLAGHGVRDAAGHAYFVAHDTDPQNLHATAISFRELNAAIGRMRAQMVVLVADSCHSGNLGWAGEDTANDIPAAFEELGTNDRMVLKMLASRPNERSFEDARWGGGHGVFTHALLDGLRGNAERESDGVVRASELIDYISRVVPEQTSSKQNPRIAGNFEPRLAMALLPRNRVGPPDTTPLTFRGPAGAGIYLDNMFRGAIRPTGELRVDRVPFGQRRISVDLPTGQSVEQTLTVSSVVDTIRVDQFAAVPVARLHSLIRMGNILEKGGAWEFYNSQQWNNENRPQAAALMSSALENLGQTCVNDYVQSTSNALKRAMLLRAVDGYEALKKLRPNDRMLEAKQKFCLARAQIAGNQLAAAEKNLRASLEIEPDFACAYNALGVALTRLERTAEAYTAFEKAIKLTPHWSLPYFQIGQQLLGRNKAKDAVPYFENAVKYNPRSMQARWTLMRVYRILGRTKEAERAGLEAIAVDPNYAPIQLELGLLYDNMRDFAKAAQAYDAYLLLAPNFADSGQVRQRRAQIK